ncbi:unnamed protein product, partial [Meganyctiphanes norvegica]
RTHSYRGSSSFDQPKSRSHQEAKFYTSRSSFEGDQQITTRETRRASGCGSELSLSNQYLSVPMETTRQIEGGAELLPSHQDVEMTELASPKRRPNQDNN